MSILPVWERMWICRALSLPKTFWHRRHLWRKNGSSLTYWDLSTTATGRKGTFSFFITVRASHGKIIYCFQVPIFLFYPFQCNKIHSKWCLVSSYLLLETITFTNDGRGGAGIRELCPFVAQFFFSPELYLQGIPKIWPSCLFKSREMQFILTSKWII